MTHEFLLPELRRQTNELHRAATTARRMIIAGHWAGWFAVAGGLLVLAAYAVGFELAWRPMSEGPATNPLTAVLFVLTGFAVTRMRPTHVPPVSLALLCLVAGISLVRIVVILAGGDGINSVPLFETTLRREAGEGTPVTFGWNSAAMFFLITLAFCLNLLGWPKARDIASAFAMAPPLVALTGYIYGIDSFHGSMSATTAIIGLPLSATPSLLGARNGLIRPISSPWNGGKYGRRLILVIGATLFLGGYAFMTADAPLGSSAFPLFVIVSIVVASTAIAFYAVTIERNDFKRRQAERTISNLVMRDRLTGFFNRRFLADQKDDICAFARREGYHVCVLLLDLDHLKFLNRGFGYEIGDMVIRHYSDAIRHSLRLADIPIRYDGDKMLCVLLNADITQAVKVAERLRDAVETLQLSAVGYRQVTVSIGAARVLTTLNEAIGRADAALASAKNFGRNRVVADRTQAGPRLIHMTPVAPAPVVDEMSVGE